MLQVYWSLPSSVTSLPLAGCLKVTPSEGHRGQLRMGARLGQCQSLVSYANSHFSGTSSALEATKTLLALSGLDESNAPSLVDDCGGGLQLEAHSLVFQKQSRVIGQSVASTGSSTRHVGEGQC